MSIDRIVLAFAGSMVSLSLLLAWFVSPYWLALAAFVGLNLLQAAFTGFCPMAMILKRLGCDILQGFALARPMAAGDIGPFVREGAWKRPRS